MPFKNSKKKMGIFLVFTLIIFSCENDGAFNREAKVSFVHINGNTYQSVYGLGGDGNISPNPDNPMEYRLPLNLNEDTVAYVFEGGAKPDTLVLRYNRRLNPYGSIDCSREQFTMDVFNLQLVAHQSTFSPDEIQIFIIPSDN